MLDEKMHKISIDAEKKFNKIITHAHDKKKN